MRELVRIIKLRLPSPKAALLFGCVIVGPSTALYDLGGGLGAFVALTAAGTLEIIFPGIITEWQNLYAYLLIGAAVTCLNLALFSLPALAIVRVFRESPPGMASFLVLSWLVFYLLHFLVLDTLYPR